MELTEAEPTTLKRRRGAAETCEAHAVRVLVVAGVRLQGERIAAVIEQAPGIEVAATAEPRDAVVAARATHPDVVLVDVTVPTAARAVRALAREPQDPRADETPLTRRELEVVALIDEGLSNKEIAHRLSIELPTVKNHVHHILEKLRVDRRGQAAARFRLRGEWEYRLRRS